jgi:protein involved in temperature-dependent protein secretion
VAGVIVPGFLLQHTVTVEEYLGSSSKGDLYGPAEAVRCLLDEKTQQITSPGGQVVTSSSSYITRPDHRPPPNSRVTLPDGRKTKVITIARPDGGSLPVPSNTQVFLQ